MALGLALGGAGCGGFLPGRPDANNRAITIQGDCSLIDGRGELAFAPRRGEAGPGFLLTAEHGAGDYDVQVNAVDAEGRYGPDARGTVHLDGGGESGTLTTPDLQTASGDTVRYAGAWSCAEVHHVTPVPEPTGGPRSPR